MINKKKELQEEAERKKKSFSNTVLTKYWKILDNEYISLNIQVNL